MKDLRRIFLIVLAGGLAAGCLNNIIMAIIEIAQAFARETRPYVFWPYVFFNPSLRELPEGLYGIRIILALAIFDFLCCMTEKRYTMSMFASSVALLVLTVLTVAFRPYTQSYVSSLLRTDDDKRVFYSMTPVVIGEGVTLAAFAALAAVYILSKARMKKSGARAYHANAPANAFRWAVFLSLTAAVFAVCVTHMQENLTVLVRPNLMFPINRYVVGVGDSIYLLRYVLTLTVFDFLCCWTEKAYTMSMFACSVATLTLVSLTLYLQPAIESAIDHIDIGVTLEQEFWGEISLLVGMGVLLLAYTALAAVYAVSKLSARARARVCATN